MNDIKIDLFCANDGKRYQIDLGTSLKEFSETLNLNLKSGQILAALVDNKLKALTYIPTISQQIEFIGYFNADGRRAYVRSLSFVLQKAVHELFPDKVLVIDHSLPNGLYCKIKETSRAEDGRPVIYSISDEEIGKIKEKMDEIIGLDLPFSQKKMRSEDAEVIFTKNNQPQKAGLQESLGSFSCSVYNLGDYQDTFYGPLIPSTGYLKVYDVIGFSDGFCLQPPMLNDFNKVLPIKRQNKIADALTKYSDWCSIIGIESVSSLNKTITDGKAVSMINMAEARHERSYAAIADKIFENRATKRIVMIAGPSSSGKTSSSLRIALQCKVLGLNPKVIELDNYFVDRDKTPKDANGEYDYESLYAMDLEFLNQQLNDLLSGKEVEIPKFDFKAGARVFNGNKLRLEEKDILIMEGIHALNPEMTSAVDNSKIFRVYVSALTSLNLDENNNVSTSDNRLLRRMVRDNRVRGIVPEDTIMRWHSVRKGESKNIFPFQENADFLFNSALIFELPMLKYYAEPLLRRISPNSPAYSEAVRLIKFLNYIVALHPSEISAIPPTSIMREFIGGQTL